MANTIDYAMMAGRVYQSSRDVINYLPDLQSQGWTEFFHVAGLSNPAFVTTAGFEAISFTNSNEIVISYAGTDQSDLIGDWAANLGLGSGTGSIQLIQAARYYLQVKADNPGTPITFTGHSLGGGLASLMAVFFNETAVTFDQAPFRNSANLVVATALRAALTLLYPASADPLAATWLEPLNKFILSYDPLGLGWSQDGLAVREAKVSNINVQGEFLTAQPLLNRIGTQQITLDHGTPDLSLAGDLHSQALLTAFLQTDKSKQDGVVTSSLREVTFKLPDLIRLIFSDKLFSFPTDKTDENFIERLVRHQTGIAGLTEGEAPITGDAMLTRFTNDMIKIAKDGGLSLSDQSPQTTNFVSKALIAFAMQKYYEEKETSASYNKQLFTDVIGGIQFDMADVSVGAGDALIAGHKINFTDVKGVDQYFSKYLLQGSVFNAEERQLIQSMLPYVRDWYVQASENAMTVTDAKNRGAFMLGGSTNDILTGGIAADLLVGNAGNDTLKGAAGNDTLLGGSGNDIYVFQTDESIDTILDKDNQGSIIFDGATLNGGIQYGDNRVYRSADKKHLYALVDNKTLIIDGQIVLKNYSKLSETFAIKLDVATALSLPVTTKEILGDLKPIDFNLEMNGEQTQFDELGNVKTDGPEVDRWDRLFDSAGNDHIVAGGGDDYVGATQGGDDYIEAGTGRDSVKGGNGNDVISGGDGADILVGDAGDDRIFAAEVITIEAAIASGHAANGGTQKGDWLSGGAGDDILVGGENNDVFSGGIGNDLIIGGAGDDDILGDSDIVPTDFHWTVFDTPEGERAFTLAIGELYPTSGGADVIYGGSGSDYVWAGMGNDIVFGDEGDDRLFGGDGNDVIFGGIGSDKITGDNGADYLDGGAANDIISGGLGDDILTGGAGEDILIGGDGNDTYLYKVGDGKDNIVDNQYGVNTLRFGEGITSSSIKLRLGSLMLDLGNGDEIHIEDFNSDDALNSSVVQNFEFADGTQLSVVELLARGFDLEGDADNNEIFGTNVTDRIYGFGGDDYIAGWYGNDELYGGDGDDYLAGEEGNDTLDGGEGSDYLDGGAGNDVYLNVDASDQIYDVEGIHSIRFENGISLEDIYVYKDTYDGAQTLVLEVGGYTTAQVNFDGRSTYHFADGSLLNQHELLGELYFEDGSKEATNNNDVFHGYAESDYLRGGVGDDRLFGYAGSDRLEGGDGHDTVIGGRGNDSLSGGIGNDIYLFSRGDGEDIILENGGVAELDIIRFAEGIQQSEVNFTRQLNGDLLIELSDESTQVTVKDWYNHNNSGISRIEFGDGTFISAEDLADLSVPVIEGNSGDDVLSGSAFNDVLVGHAGNDILDGDGGSDYLDGGDGEDTYIFKYGMGRDTVLDVSLGGNLIQLNTGLNFSDLNANRDGNNLVLSIAGSEEGVILKDYYLNPQGWTIKNETGLEQDVEQAVSATQNIQQNKVDSLWRDYVAHLSSTEMSNAFSNGFVLQADGTIYKSWESSYGALNAYANVQGLTVTNKQTVTFSPDFYNGATTVTTTVSSSTPQILWGNYGPVSESLSINRINSFSDAEYIYAWSGAGSYVSNVAQQVIAEIEWQPINWDSSYEYSDETTGVVIEENQIIGLVKNETTYLQQSGYVKGVISQILPDGSVPLSDGVFSKYVSSQLIVSNQITNIVETHAGASNNIIYGNSYSLVDAGDGNDSVYDAGLAFGGAGDDFLYGGDVQIGGEGNDTLLYGKILFGGEGDDFMDGGNGATRYLIDPIESGIDTISDSGDSNGRYTNWIYEAHGISDPEPYVGAWIIGVVDENNNARSVESSSGDNVYASYEEAVNYVTSNYSHDPDRMEEMLESIYYSPPLPDVPYVSARDYTALQTLYEAGVIEQDSIEFGAGLDPDDVVVRWEGDGFISLSWDDGKAIRVKMPTAFDALGSGIELFKFQDGTVWNMAMLEARALAPIGTQNDDVIFGSPNDDSLSGLQGNDQLYGAGGNDTYVFNLGDGHDEIIEYVDDGNDVLELGEGIAAATTQTFRENSDLILKFNANDQVRLQNYFDLTWDSINFSDGTKWDRLAVENKVVYQGTEDDDILGGSNGTSNRLNGYSGNDELYGGDELDILQGMDGDDMLIDASGSNFFNAGAGSDYISGGTGNELFIGGSGDDYIETGGGSDVILFNIGDGKDTIAADGEANNTLSLGHGISYADLSFSQSGNDLILLTGTDEQITFENWYASVDNHNIANLQMIIDGAGDYDSTSTNTLNNKKIQQFNFDSLVTTFDQARLANPALTSWALSSSLLGFHLGGSDNAAIGGDLAYQYAKNGDLSNISVAPAQSILGNTQFGTAAQNLVAVGSLQDSSTRLM